MPPAAPVMIATFPAKSCAIRSFPFTAHDEQKSRRRQVFRALRGKRRYAARRMPRPFFGPTTPIAFAHRGGAKCWPAQYYGELARPYLDKGWQIVLYGSGNDRAVCEEVGQHAGEHASCHNLAGQTALGEAVDLLSLSAAVVCNDSGLMHIAAALGRPLLAIYGATSPAFTPPLNPRSSLLVSDIDCAPCFERECPLGHHRCMRDMRPARALAALEYLLENTG